MWKVESSVFELRPNPSPDAREGMAGALITTSMAIDSSGRDGARGFSAGLALRLVVSAESLEDRDGFEIVKEQRGF